MLVRLQDQCIADLISYQNVNVLIMIFGVQALHCSRTDSQQCGGKARAMCSKQRQRLGHAMNRHSVPQVQRIRANSDSVLGLGPDLGSGNGTATGATSKSVSSGLYVLSVVNKYERITPTRKNIQGLHTQMDNKHAGKERKAEESKPPVNLVKRRIESYNELTKTDDGQIIKRGIRKSRSCKETKGQIHSCTYTRQSSLYDQTKIKIKSLIVGQGETVSHRSNTSDVSNSSFNISEDRKPPLRPKPLLATKEPPKKGGIISASYDKNKNPSLCKNFNINIDKQSSVSYNKDKNREAGKICCTLCKHRTKYMNVEKFNVLNEDKNISLLNADRFRGEQKTEVQRSSKVINASSADKIRGTSMQENVKPRDNNNELLSEDSKNAITGTIANVNKNVKAKRNTNVSRVEDGEEINHFRNVKGNDSPVGIDEGCDNFEAHKQVKEIPGEHKLSKDLKEKLSLKYDDSSFLYSGSATYSEDIDKFDDTEVTVKYLPEQSEEDDKKDSAYYSGGNVLHSMAEEEINHQETDSIIYNEDYSSTDGDSDGSLRDDERFKIPTRTLSVSQQGHSETENTQKLIQWSYSSPEKGNKSQIANNLNTETILSKRQYKEQYIPACYDNRLYYSLTDFQATSPSEIGNALPEAKNETLILKYQHLGLPSDLVTPVEERKDTKAFEVVEYPKALKESLDIYRENTSSSTGKAGSFPRECTMKMLNIIKEIKDTEENYIKSLRVIVREYLPLMEQPNMPPSLIGKRNLIFSNILQIYEWHKRKFYPSLKACDDVKKVAICFLNHKKLFEEYPEYCRNNPEASKLVTAYAAYFKEKQNQLKDPFDLNNYLLTPVTRLGKYILLLKSLVKECDKNEFNVEVLGQAVGMMEHHMNRGNDLLSYDDIRNCPGRKDQGRLILSDAFTVWTNYTRWKAFEAMVFYFEHSIIITNIKQQNNKEYYYFNALIGMRDFSFTPKLDDPLEIEICHSKNNQKTIYNLKAQKKEIKQKWASLIQQNLWKQLIEERKRQPSIKNVQYITIAPRPKSDVKETGKGTCEHGSSKSLDTKGTTNWYTNA